MDQSDPQYPNSKITTHPNTKPNHHMPDNITPPVKNKSMFLKYSARSSVSTLSDPFFRISQQFF